MSRQAISRVEDLQPGDRRRFEYNADRGEWAFTIIGSVGYPRQTLGVLVLTLKDDGAIVLTIK